MSSAPMHESQMPEKERRANRRILLVTLLTTAVILAIAVGFFLFGKAQH
jgi:hypothetical protein